MNNFLVGIAYGNMCFETIEKSKNTMSLYLFMKRGSWNGRITLIVHSAEKLHQCTVPLIQDNLEKLPPTEIIWDHHKGPTNFPEGTYLLYPEGTPLQNFADDYDRIDNLVIIDGPWRKALAITRYPQHATLPKIALTKHQTRYLRGNNQTIRENLATAEALHYFLLEVGWGESPLLDAMLDKFKKSE